MQVTLKLDMFQGLLWGFSSSGTDKTIMNKAESLSEWLRALAVQVLRQVSRYDVRAAA